MIYLLRILFLFIFVFLQVHAFAHASSGVDDDNESVSLTPPILSALPVTQITRLMTADEHIAYLKKRIQEACKTILISSHGINHYALLNADLYTDLGDACRRGVGIHIYNTQDKNLPTLTQKFFDDRGIKYDSSHSHAKVLAVDGEHFAVGSCNWLNGYGWENATVCLSGDLSQAIDIARQELRYHENKTLHNFAAKVLEEGPLLLRMGRLELDHLNTVQYLHAVAHHKAFIQEAFNTAQKRIIFCSPFIHTASGYRADFSSVVLSKTIKKGVHVYLVSCQEGYGVRGMKTHLYDLRSPFLHFITLPNFHLKTVIVDNTIIADGSFNWFSSNRYVSSPYQRYEISLVLRGSKAAEFIGKFEKESSVGRAIARIEKPLDTPVVEGRLVGRKRLFTEDAPSSQEDDSHGSGQDSKTPRTQEVAHSHESFPQRTPALNKISNL